MGQERGHITVRNNERAIEVVSDRLTEHDPQQKRRGFEAARTQHVATDAEERGDPEIERTVDDGEP
jgi:hypothetical protein